MKIGRESSRASRASVGVIAAMLCSTGGIAAPQAGVFLARCA